MSTEYIVVLQSVWASPGLGSGITYGWDGDRFPTREAAIKHGFKIRESDDFNVGVVDGSHLVSFDWMEAPIGEDDESMAEIAEALGLEFVPEQEAAR